MGWSYEGGLKGTLMGGRSRFAVAAFFMDYTNLQVQTPIGIAVFDIRNAAAATICGVEVEHTSRFGRGFQAAVTSPGSTRRTTITSPSITSTSQVTSPATG